MIQTQVTLTPQATQELEALARTLVSELRRIAAPAAAGMEQEADREAFACSLGVQALGRVMLEVDQDAARHQFVLLGVGEGLGMLLGLIPDAGQRAMLFQQCLQAMDIGMKLQAQIHAPAEGNA